MSTLERSRQVLPPAMSRHDVEMARMAQRLIMESLDRSHAANITLTADSGDPLPPIEVPPAALRLIGQLLGLISEGRPITLLPSNQELTTVEAANLLNVSRPFLIREIEAGRLPARLVGSHRRIALEDLKAYELSMRAQQQTALDRLAANEKELGLDY